MKLLLNRIKLALQKKTKVTQNKKSYEAWAAKGYNPTPLVSVIIQSHNKSLEVLHIVKKLRKYPSAEIIVLDDGSSINHSTAFIKEMTNANEFVIRANDLYEISTYDKAIRFANGKYIALLQDDDDFDSLSWIDRGVELLDSHPKLVILGGRDGQDLIVNDDKKTLNNKVVTADTAFSYVATVNRAPMWLNKELYTEHLKSLDMSLIPFMYDDTELCIRAWLSNLQVGRYDAQFKSLSAGGMRLWNGEFARRQAIVNSQLLYQRYESKREIIKERIAEAERLA